jgi:tRNA 2-thiouridine synthesizing protein A
MGSLTDPPAGRRLVTIRAETVVAAVDEASGTACRACGRELCGHDVVFSIVSGFADALRCVGCLAGAQDEDALEFATRAWRYIRRTDCFLAGWEAADRRETRPIASPPPCSHRAEVAAADHPAPPGAADPGPRDPDNASRRDISWPIPRADQEWDAGTMACGELLVELRRRLSALPAQAVLRVRAEDPAAPEDIPAWCRLTRHRLVHHEHPIYDIQPRED